MIRLHEYQEYMIEAVCEVAFAVHGQRRGVSPTVPGYLRLSESAPREHASRIIHSTHIISRFAFLPANGASVEFADASRGNHTCEFPPSIHPSGSAP